MPATLLPALAEGIAIEAMKMVLRWLPRAVDNGEDLEARGHMLVAASMGATAFQKGLGSIHSISHVLGALYGTHHGLANAVVLPYGVARNARFLAARMPELCHALGVEGDDTAALVDHLLDFRRRLEIPNALSELDMDDSQAVDIGRRALIDSSTLTNAGTVTADDLSKLFRDAVAGNIVIQET